MSAERRAVPTKGTLMLLFGRDCSHSEVHSAEETKPARTKLRIYMYQLPMEVR
jgi:hypothetical protein